ncbi:MAG: type VI secretion system lipoprotein TssJ [Planctomycetota bacterium]|jgi:type VI secretion system VasD/TssJ family lipoprotein
MPRSAILAILILAGCGTDVIYVKGVRPMNRNELGESTPVNVRIYLLKDDKKFRDSEFEDLWTGDKELLAEDLNGPPVVTTVLPGDEDDDPKKVDIGHVGSETRYVGFMALYPKSWKGQKRRRVVAAAESDHCVFELRGYGIVLDTEKEFETLDPTVPIEIQVFQLRAETRFLRADPDDLLFKARAVLDEDLLSQPVKRSVLAVDEHGTPGYVNVGDLKTATRSLGVVAVYVKHGSQEKKKKIIPVDEKSDYVFDVGGYGIAIRTERK